MLAAQSVLEEAQCTGALDLSCRQLTAVPSGLSACASLIALNLSCNSLHELPDDIVLLQALEILDVSYNQLQCLPNRLRSLSRLQSLNAAYNHLTSIPDEIGFLPSITSLYMNDNKLTQVPGSITQLTSLEVLHLHYNLLTSLPPGLHDLPHLTDLTTEGNSLKLQPHVSTPDQPACRDVVPVPAATTYNYTPGSRQTSHSAQVSHTQEPPHSAVQQAGTSVDVLVVNDTDDGLGLGSAGGSSRGGARIQSQASRVLPGGRGMAADECVDVDAPGINILGDACDVLVAQQQSPDTAQPQPGGDEQLLDCIAMLTNHTLEDLQDLPPACAAAMYNSLAAVQIGLQETREGRPLSRGGTAVPGAGLPGSRSGQQSRGSILASRPATSSRPRTALTASSLSRPGSSWGWGQAGGRPGTAQGRPGQLTGLPSTGSHNELLNSSSVQAVEQHKAPSWMAHTQPAGVHALLSGPPRPSTAASYRAERAAGWAPSAGSQAAPMSSVLPGGGQAGLASLPPVTFPLTAGVRSMMRQLSGVAAQPGQPGTGSLGGQPSVQTLGADQVEGAAGLDDDHLSIARQLLGVRKPELLAGLDMLIAEEAEEGGDTLDDLD